MKRQRYCPTSGRSGLVTIKEITLLHPVDPYSGITRSLISRFDSRLYQVTMTALWDAKRCHRERQSILDQTTSSESKDTNSYSTRCWCRQKCQCGTLLLQVLTVMLYRLFRFVSMSYERKKARDRPSVCLDGRENLMSSLRTGRFSRIITEVNNGTKLKKLMNEKRHECYNGTRIEFLWLSYK